MPVRLVVGKNGVLLEQTIVFEVLQEYAVGGRGERIVLGNVRLNLSEYVDQSDGGDDEGVCRRHLMQDSKINSTLKVRWMLCVCLSELTAADRCLHETDRGRQELHRVGIPRGRPPYLTPSSPVLKTAQVFSGIAGLVSGEQGEAEDAGGTLSHRPLSQAVRANRWPATPSLTTKSREAGELQDMYRRTLAAFWTAQPGELKADECIEDIFAGGDGWGDRDKPYDSAPAASALLDGAASRAGGRGGSMGESEPLAAHAAAASRAQHRAAEAHRKSHETLRPADADAVGSRPRSSGLEHQASKLQPDDRHRYRRVNDVDEFAVRDDLRCWRLPRVTEERRR